jgi:hypothetical protein
MRILVILALGTATFLRRSYPGVQEAAWNAYTQPATYTDEREAPPLDTRCRFNYPECAPTCVNRYVARNSTIYKFPNKGCFMALAACKIHKCFDTPQLFPLDMKRVTCPITVCEFAAGLHRPKFDPLVPDPPNLTKRAVKRNGEEIEVPFHERYMAGKRCYAGSWALRQSTDRKALREHCEGITNETVCRERATCSWRPDAPRWFHEEVKHQPEAAVPYLTTTDQILPPKPEAIKSLYDEEDASDAGNATDGRAEADGAVSLFGPEDCVALWRKNGTCVLSTQCQDVNISAYEIAFLCVDEHGLEVKHSYGDGGTAGPGIAEEEEKDTEVSCAECKPIPEVNPDYDVVPEWYDNIYGFKDRWR